MCNCVNDGRDRKQARREEEHYPRGRRSERPIGTELGFGDGPRREGGCLAPGGEARSAARSSSGLCGLCLGVDSCVFGALRSDVGDFEKRRGGVLEVAWL